MDTKLEEALDLSNFITTFNNQKRLLWEKYQDDLLVYVNGHEIKITQELISLCDRLCSRNNNTVVLIDSNNLPFEVENLEEFLENILDQFTQASNRYFTEYKKLKSSRSVEKVIDV